MVDVSTRATESERVQDVRAGKGDSPLVLGIETSCDETAAAVVAGERRVLSSVVSSQVDLHAVYGGVVPEVAGRAHLERIFPVVSEAMVRADVVGPDLDAVAVTVGPGLVGALLVGVSVAKGLALAWDLPIVGVNHLEAHLFAPLLEGAAPPFPWVVLLVSGGHTLLVESRGVGDHRVLGATLDDAAGEAFDKVARFLGLGYPGGPEIDRLSESGDATAVALPRAMWGVGLDFSFSGLKTAVVHRLREDPSLSTADVAASFQEAVVDVLVDKTMRAAEMVGARSVCLAGGVGANRRLRARLSEACARVGLECRLPTPHYCTDNAAMVAAAGAWILSHRGPSRLDLAVDPSLALDGP
ncbi:MAG: tRNA N6-adenosine threonylcarbamoyltransferase [Acidimicrobiales bacterium]|nr:MAG: tRNA N6-adenosine threonylcarbamoyltransferase [Acidimicrobiales bacterium]